MKYLAILLLIFGFGLSSFGQTIKSLGYNTTNGLVVANTTNALTFTNETRFGGGDIIIQSPSISWAGGNYGIHLEEAYLFFEGQEKLQWREGDIEISVPFSFSGTNTAPSTRANLGFSTNLNTLWTSTNASDARIAVGLGQTNNVQFGSIGGYGSNVIRGYLSFEGTSAGQLASSLATTRTNLGLGGGVTATNTFVSYNGTNYTTNTVTISNGIITGWTQ